MWPLTRIHRRPQREDDLELRKLLENPNTAPYSRIKFLSTFGREDQIVEFLNGLFLTAVESKHAGNWEALYHFIEGWENTAIGLQFMDIVLPDLGPLPWATLDKPLDQSTVALITTGGLYLAGQTAFTETGDPSFRVIPKNARPTDFRIWHAGYDNGPARKDINCIFPIDRFRELERERVIGVLAESNYAFMGLIPEPSRLIEQTAPEVARRLKDDGVDAVLLASTCPVCCRSVGLIARAIEAMGIPTVITMMYQQMADAIEAPRVVHALFPFGQPLGEPENPDQHRIMIEDALHLLVTASETGSVVHLPYRWGLEDYAKIREDRGNILAL